MRILQQPDGYFFSFGLDDRRYSTVARVGHRLYLRKLATQGREAL